LRGLRSANEPTEAEPVSDPTITAPISDAPAAERAAGKHARATEWRYRTRGLEALLVVLVFLWLGLMVLGFTWGLFVVEASVITACLLLDAKLTPLIGRWRRGAEGEERVGRVLDGLQQTGWFALHDVALGRGNIDHVLVGPGGLYTIETKGHRGRIKAEDIDPRMLKQAYAEAKVIERITGLRAQPLLVFSDAYLTPAISRHQGVWILPARLLGQHLKRLHSSIPASRVAEVYQRLAAALPG
jgi:hypothetical protein